MPTYEYLCRDCGHQWEAFQSIKDAALKVCVRCGKETAERQVTGGGGFILKGGGWYADLYGSSKAKGGGETKANGSASSTSSTSDASSSGDKSSSASSGASTSSTSDAKSTSTSTSTSTGSSGSS